MSFINTTGNVLSVSSNFALVQWTEGICQIPNYKLIDKKTKTPLQVSQVLTVGDTVHMDVETCDPFIAVVDNLPEQVDFAATRAWFSEKHSFYQSVAKKSQSTLKIVGNGHPSTSSNNHEVQHTVSKDSKDALESVYNFIQNKKNKIPIGKLPDFYANSFPKKLKQVVAPSFGNFLEFLKSQKAFFKITATDVSLHPVQLPTAKPKKRAPKPKKSSPNPKTSAPNPKIPPPKPKTIAPKPKKSPPNPKTAASNPKIPSKPKTVTPKPKTQPPEPVVGTSQLDQEARDYLCEFLRQNNGSVNISTIISQSSTFPKQISTITGTTLLTLSNFISRHPGFLKMTGPTVTLCGTKKPAKVPPPPFTETQVATPKEVILWSWGTGTIIAVGNSFGYIQSESGPDIHPVSFDTDSLILDKEPEESSKLTGIFKGDSVHFIAYSCPDGSGEGFCWRALVTWKSGMGPNGLRNNTVRVVTGKVSRVIPEGGSVIFGDIRIPVSTSVMMSRIAVKDARRVISVGDEVSCVVREATVEYLPCLIVECVWKVEIFPGIPKTRTEQPIKDYYGGGKVLQVTPTGGILRYKDQHDVHFTSDILYSDGYHVPLSSLKKGEYIFFTGPGSDVPTNANLVWKGKKPELLKAKNNGFSICEDNPKPSTSFQMNHDDSAKELINLSEDGDEFLYLKKDIPSSSSGSSGDRGASLDLDDQGGMLTKVGGSADNHRSAVEEVQKQVMSEILVEEVLDMMSAVKRDKRNSGGTRSSTTQTISTGDIISLRLHTS